MFLFVLAETIFLRRTCGSIQRNSGQVSSDAGDSKGGQASPFESSRKRGSRGRNPIERVSPPVRAFAYFSHEGKVTRVRAGKAREPSNRIAAIRGKETCFSPARRRAHLSPSVPCACTGKAKTGPGGGAPAQIHKLTAPPGTAPGSPGTAPRSSDPRRRPPWAGGWRGSSPAGC